MGQNNDKLTAKMNNNSMKPPYASSIPYLMDLDPTAPFEFQFLAQELTWDPAMDFPTFTTTTDGLAKYRPKEYQPTNPKQNLYLLDFTVSPNYEEENCRHSPREESPINEEEICRHSPREEDPLVQKLISMISDAAPRNIYKRQRFSMKRKRNRKKRKRISTSAIEPEFRSLWINYVGVLPATTDPVLTLDTTATPRESLDTEPPPAVTTAPPSLYPQVDWNQVDTRSHKNLPEPEYFPIHGCFHNLPSNSNRYYPPHPYEPDSTYKTPHGQLQGFLTEDGVIPLGGHDQTILGYIWSDLYSKWVLRNTKRRKEEFGLGSRSSSLPSTPLRCSTPRTSTGRTATRTRTVWPRSRGR